MKKLVLFSVATLMLASSVFAPVATAQEPGDVDIQSVTIEPDGRWTVTGTIECIQGGDYLRTDLIYKNLKPKPTGEVQFLKKGIKSLSVRLVQGVPCETTGPQSFTTRLRPPTPLAKKDKVWVVVVSHGVVDDFSDLAIERVKIR